MDPPPFIIGGPSPLKGTFAAHLGQVPCLFFYEMRTVCGDIIFVLIVLTRLDGRSLCRQPQDTLSYLESITYK